MELFAERGYEATTIADVAASAEVSPRTVPLYFPTKLDLALAYSDAAALRMMALLEESADDESVLDLLARFVEHEIFQESEALSRNRKMLEANLWLRGVRSSVGAGATQRAKVKLAKDLGRDIDDVVVTLVGAAVEGLIRAVLELDPDVHDVGAAFASAVQTLEQFLHAARHDTPVG